MDYSVSLESSVHRHLCDSLPYFLQSFLKCCFLSVTFLAMVAKFETSPSDTLTFFPPALLFFFFYFILLYNTVLVLPYIDIHSTYHHQPYDIFYLYLLPFSLDYRILKERDLHIPILFTDVSQAPRTVFGT